MSALALALALAAAFARAEEPPVSRYASASGAWQLTVTRTEKRWNGPVELVLVHDGAEAWRATHELGLREAVVSDEGQVAGYGYTGKDEALNAPAPPPTGPLGMVVRVFAFSPIGEVLLDVSEERRGSLYPHSPAVPQVEGLFLQPEVERFVLRIQDEDLNGMAEEWHPYELVTGKALERTRPKLALGLADPVRSLLDARPIPGTPLVLLNWSRQVNHKENGQLFQLVDPGWKVLWNLERLHDLERLPSTDLHSFWAQGAILETGPRFFELHFVAPNERVTFHVLREDEGWVVNELAHAPYGPAPALSPGR